VRLLNLFKDNGVADIQGFVEQTIPDPEDNREILEEAVALMEDIKLRANFEVYLKKFLQKHGHRAAQCGGRSLPDSRQAVRVPSPAGQGDGTRTSR
jgi:hypothetical protein